MKQMMHLVIAVFMMATMVFNPLVAFAISCPVFAGVQTTPTSDGTACHVGPIDVEEHGGRLADKVPQGWTVDYWDGEPKSAGPGEEIKVVEATFKPIGGTTTSAATVQSDDGSPPVSLLPPPPANNTCPNWGSMPTNPTNDGTGGCIGKWNKPVTGGVPDQWTADLWDPSIRDVRTAQPGEVLEVDEVTLKPAPGIFALQPKQVTTTTQQTTQQVVSANGCPSIGGHQLENLGVDPSRGMKCKLWQVQSPVQYTVEANVSVDYLDAGGAVHTWVTSGTLFMREATLYIK